MSQNSYQMTTIFDRTFAGLGVAHRNKIEKYRGSSSLVDNIAERFRVGVGSVRVEAITLS